jgi:hypothetical protein
MDINGAKALKERLGLHGASEAPRSPAAVPADAPPVYHWLGVSQTATSSAAHADDDSAAPRASFLRRLGLSFR